MLNLELGIPRNVEGRSCLVTTPGVSGHAIYGPYEMLEAGRYAVQFPIELVEAPDKGLDHRCAVLDVVTESGNKVLARKEIYVSHMRSGAKTFVVKFKLKTATQVEYRVWVNGFCSLLLGEHRPVASLDGAHGTLETLLSSQAFPGPEGSDVPFFNENRERLRQLYEEGIGVRIFDQAVALTVDGVSLYAKQFDDLNFIGEVFHEKVYAFKTSAPVVAIDIGMNIGLSSLTFASQPEVVAVHAFEPFSNTFDRAIDNIDLNPGLSDKIKPWNFGLSDRNFDDTIIVAQDSDSGAMSTVGAPDGVAIHVQLRDAAEVIGPIIATARQQGAKVVVKVDCEGSEFAIFRSLEEAELLPKISAFMVEWHALFPDRDQNTLIRPLENAGFIVFDRSPRVGNGFFYAVRMAD